MTPFPPSGTWKRRKVFVSYHHAGDQGWYDRLSEAFHDRFQLLTNNSLDRRVDSGDVRYVMRRIREHHLHGSSCTLVLCGADTWRRKYVDWEVFASLQQGTGLVGIWLPTLSSGANGGTMKPARLQDNLDSGYAVRTSWGALATDPAALLDAIEAAVRRPGSMVKNGRARMVRNL